MAGYLTVGLAQVVPLYRLEKGGAFRTATGEGIGFATTHLARAAAELRDLVTMAWADSDNAGVGYPAINIRELEKGGAPAFQNFRE